MNAGPQNDLICGIQCSLGADSSQFGFPGPRPAMMIREAEQSYFGCRLVASEAEHGEECLLGISTLPTSFILALPFLLLEQLALSRHIAAIAFRQDVFPHGADRLASDDAAADRRLNWYVEHLAGDKPTQVFDQFPAAGVGVVAVRDQREGVNRLTIDENIELHQVRRAHVLEDIVK